MIAPMIIWHFLPFEENKQKLQKYTFTYSINTFKLLGPTDEK